MPSISHFLRDERASSFWRDVQRPWVQATAVICVGVWIKVYLILADDVTNWWHTRTALETISHWWK
jgi:hypothetical protein